MADGGRRMTSKFGIYGTLSASLSNVSALTAVRHGCALKARVKALEERLHIFIKHPMYYDDKDGVDKIPNTNDMCCIAIGQTVSRAYCFYVVVEEMQSEI